MFANGASTRSVNEGLLFSEFLLVLGRGRNTDQSGV